MLYTPNRDSIVDICIIFRRLNIICVVSSADGKNDVKNHVVGVRNRQ